MQDQALWAALENHPLPLAEVGTDLERRVLTFGRIGSRKTRAIMREYRRFLYLAAIGGPSVAAPLMLQQVWRLHARNHQSYTVDLMRGLIRRRMPEPFDAPLPASDPAHASTRALYRREFGRRPPSRLWPGPFALGARRVLTWANVALGGLTFYCFISEEIAWAMVAAVASGTAMMARQVMTPWAFEVAEGAIDLDFGGNDMTVGLLGDGD
ncbi:MAG: hypothetical protein HC844_19275 [Tabrizicola sp.]|nr:hypothetical protein [Tabrizicola sp.]